MATSRIAVSEGSGKNVATYSITEDAVTKELGRNVLVDSTGAEITTLPISGTVSVTGVATAANQSTANTSLSNIDTNAGATTDAVVAAGAAGSIAAKLRRVTTDLDAVKTSVASIDGKTTAVNTGSVTIGAALPAGTNAIGKLSANSGVDIGDVDVTTVGTITPGTAATSLGKAEDAGHSSGDVGVFSLGVRNDTMATQTSNDGDYGAIAISKSGRVLVTPAPADAYVFGNASVAGTGDTSLVAASGSASLKTYITNLSFANTGSSNTLITVKDGNAGSTLFYTIAPAGGGSNIQLDIPIVTTANTALYFACGTSSTTVYASATGYVAP